MAQGATHAVCIYGVEPHRFSARVETGPSETELTPVDLTAATIDAHIDDGATTLITSWDIQPLGDQTLIPNWAPGVTYTVGQQIEATTETVDGALLHIWTATSNHTAGTAFTAAEALANWTDNGQATRGWVNLELAEANILLLTPWDQTWYFDLRVVIAGEASYPIRRSPITRVLAVTDT